MSHPSATVGFLPRAVDEVDAMRRLGKKCVDRIFGYLEAGVAAALAGSVEAFALVREQDVALDDVDRAVLLHALSGANRYLGTLLCALDDESDFEDEGAAAAHAVELASKSRSPTEPHPDGPRGHLIAIMCAAHDHALRVRRLLVRLRMGSNHRVPVVLGAAAARLEVGLFLLGVERVAAPRRPRDRVQLASAREQLELVVEEYREAVRGFRMGPDPGDAMTPA